MFCMSCGKPMSDGALFCGNCGTKVQTVVPAAPAAVPVTPIIEAVPPVAEIPVAEEATVVAPIIETPAPVAEAPVPVVEAPAPVVVAQSFVPEDAQLDKTITVEPNEPVIVPPVVQPQFPEQPPFQPYQQPQYPPQYPQPQYDPQYQYPYQPEYQEKPAKKSGKKVLIALVAAVALVAIGLLLWFFVFNVNDLEGTQWIGDRGDTIIFTDDDEGYWNLGLGGNQEFDYSIDGDKLKLTFDDMGETVTMKYKVKGDTLTLTMGGESMEYSSAKGSFVCDSCSQTCTGKKHSGKLDGYTYLFCDDCWDFAQQYVD